MTDQSFVLLFLLMVMSITITANDQNDWESKCSRCRCHWKSSKKTADCRDTGQMSIPSDLHSDIQSLDLSNNNIAGKSKYTHSQHHSYFYSLFQQRFKEISYRITTYTIFTS